VNEKADDLDRTDARYERGQGGAARLGFGRVA
jgi:hypothetical protein